MTGMSFTSAIFTLFLTKLHIDMQEIYFELIINNKIITRSTSHGYTPLALPVLHS